jgi:seryl-tRNA synthetase
MQMRLLRAAALVLCLQQRVAKPAVVIVQRATRLPQVIDLKAARAHPAQYRAALARRGAEKDFDALLDADSRWREHTERAESLRAAQKRSSKGRPTEEELAALRQLREELTVAAEEQAHAARERDDLLARIPNLPDPTAADGMDEEDAQVVRTWGERPAFDFEPRDALELGSPRGWIDMARGARLSGSRFAYRFGDVALAEMALYRYVIDKLTREGFLLVLPPILVGERAMYGTGFLPTEESNLYQLEKDELYLTGTSEVALAGIHTDERLDESDLPAKYVAFTTNFRREAGAAGKDTKGMFRVHQFDKVEMYVYCQPEASQDMHEQLLAYEEDIAQSLGLPYQVMNIAVGDLGGPAAKKYDIEAWFPVQQRYREITSCSNTTDYQARRLNIRFRRDGQLEFAHTLNGTGATARALLSIMENFQDENGAVAVPRVLSDFGAPAVIGRHESG